MPADNELLRHYVETGEEASFAEVVRRHADLVYSAALRLTNGDAALAQDVSQQVFIDLARKAGTLLQHATLVGWLHITTRYNANRAIRGEQRRRAREQETMIMQNETSGTEPHWAQISPLLDEAVGQLNSKEGEAVLLRFFKDKSYREVGDVLGLSEDSARKRVDRALEKLRAYFSRRGVKASSALLAASIVTHSVQAAPVGLAEGWSGAALASQNGLVTAISPKLRSSSSFFTKFVLISMGILVIGGLVAISSGWLIHPTPDQSGRQSAVKEKVALQQTMIEQPKAPPVSAKNSRGPNLATNPSRPIPVVGINSGEFETRAYPLDSGFLASLPGYSNGESASITTLRLKTFFYHLGMKFPDDDKVNFEDNGKLYITATPDDLDSLNRLIHGTRVRSPTLTPDGVPGNLPVGGMLEDGSETSVLPPSPVATAPMLKDVKGKTNSDPSQLK